MSSTSPGRLRRGFDKHWYAYAMVIPTVLVLGVLVLYPLVQGVYQSFTNLNEANAQSEICTKVLGGAETCKPNPQAAKFVGVDNYVDVLSGNVGHFWLQFTNTLVWTLACVVFHYGLGLGLAILLNRKVRGRSIYRVLLIVPVGGARVHQRVRVAVPLRPEVRPDQRLAVRGRHRPASPGSTTAGRRCSPRSSPTSGSACRS